jgi:hypothetical protein
LCHTPTVTDGIKNDSIITIATACNRSDRHLCPTHENIAWLRPKPNLTHEEIDPVIKRTLSAFELTIDISYRTFQSEQELCMLACRYRLSFMHRMAYQRATKSLDHIGWGDYWERLRDDLQATFFFIIHPDQRPYPHVSYQVWDAVWGAADVIARSSLTYKSDTPLLRMIDIWELGVFPIGRSHTSYIIGVPMV